MLKHYNNVLNIWPMNVIKIKLHLLLTLGLLLAACSAPQEKPRQKIIVTPQQMEIYDTAVSYMKNNRGEQALTAFKDLLKQNPAIANAHVNIGILQYENKNFAAAEASFKKAIAIEPANYIAFNQLGILYRAQGKFADAEKAYKNSLENNENYDRVHLNIGILYDLYMYKLDNALEHYKKYQSLQKKEDPKVAKWIVELDRRIKK